MWSSIKNYQYKNLASFEKKHCCDFAENFMHKSVFTIERYKYDFIFMFYSHAVYICKTERNKELELVKCYDETNIKVFALSLWLKISWG